MQNSRQIYVYFDSQDFQKPVFMGILNSEMLRGKEVFSFENDQKWLENKSLRSLDPDLSEFMGKQYLPAGKSNFGLFLDSSPDRWGRILMRKREALRARMENRPAVNLNETDYLMGVFDGNRMGALRFKYAQEGEFMDNDRKLATPPVSSVRELEYASLQIEKEEFKSNDEYSKWLNMLVAPGSSLGGARPKSNVVDEDGSLWIAKFPGNFDNKDVGAWEAVVAELAKHCGIIVPEFKILKLTHRYKTYLTKRFDRTTSGHRIHFASAMTLLGYSDGVGSSEGVSYLEMAEWIMANCIDTDFNLQQLWRRIVFNIAVSNCDDHLRNHGFLLTKNGWVISPAFDVNPDEYGTGLKLNISENDNSLDFDLALSVAKYFGLKNTYAKDIISEMRSVTAGWHKTASKFGIPKPEQEMMAGAFRLVDSD